MHSVRDVCQKVEKTLRDSNVAPRPRPGPMPPRVLETVGLEELWESFGRFWRRFDSAQGISLYHKTPDQPHLAADVIIY